jgi:hypothetical protein
MQLKSLTGHTGAITWWSLGSETDPDTLLHRFEQLDLPKYAPEQRSWLMSLKAGLQEMYPGHMVRPLKKREKNGYTIVKEIPGESENDFPAIASATITKDGLVIIRSGDVDLHTLQQRVYHFHRVLPAASVSAVMVEIVNSVLGGLAMRDGGGVYFIPDEHVGKWLNISRAIEESACEGTQNNITACPMETNAMTLRDIRDSIVREVSTECLSIRKELAENDLRERAIVNRAARSSILFDRIRQYEDLLGETLKACRESLKPTIQALQAAQAQKATVEVFSDMYEVA